MIPLTLPVVLEVKNRHLAYLSRNSDESQSLRNYINSDSGISGAVAVHCGSRDPRPEEFEAIFFAIWQNKWDASTKGRWTHRLIPHLTEWIRRKRGGLTYYVTQALTRHGCFGVYLHCMGKERTPECWMCGAGEDVPQFSCRVVRTLQLPCLKLQLHLSLYLRLMSLRLRRGLTLGSRERDPVNDALTPFASRLEENNLTKEDVKSLSD